MERVVAYALAGDPYDIGWRGGRSVGSPIHAIHAEAHVVCGVRMRRMVCAGVARTRESEEGDEDRLDDAVIDR